MKIENKSKNQLELDYLLPIFGNTGGMDTQGMAAEMMMMQAQLNQTIQNQLLMLNPRDEPGFGAHGAHGGHGGGGGNWGGRGRRGGRGGRK